MDLNNLVLSRIKEKALTAYRVGKDTGIPYQSIQAILNGERNVENFSLKVGIVLLMYLFKEKEIIDMFRKIKKN